MIFSTKSKEKEKTLESKASKDKLKPQSDNGKSVNFQNETAKGKGSEDELVGKKKIKKKNGYEGSDFRKRIKTKLLIMSFINIFVLVVLIFILNRLMIKAEELKKLRNTIIIAKQSVDLNYADLELKSNQDAADKLFALYPDDVGLVNFVQEIEKLKNEGVVKNFSFANQVLVRDKTKYLGIPVAIELEGTWEQINIDLEKLQILPFLLRPVNVQSRKKIVEENIINMKYGGFLYVSENMEKN